jgi:hypothetical protein
LPLAHNTDVEKSQCQQGIHYYMTIDYCWIMQQGEQQEQPSNQHHQEQLHKEFKAVNTQRFT